MPRWPDPSQVTWTPGTTDGLSYEQAEFNAKRLLVYRNLHGRFEIVIDGFARDGSYRTAEEAKAAAVRKAVM